MRKDSVLSIRSDKRFRLVFLAIFFAVLFAIAYIFRFFLWSFLFALVCYVALKPLHDYLLRYIKRRWVCTFIIISVFTLVIIIPFFLLLTVLADQTLKFYHILDKQGLSYEIQQYLYGNDNIRKGMNFFNISRAELLEQIINVLKNKSGVFLSKLTQMITFSISFVINFFFMILIMVTFFSGGKPLGDLVYHIIPFPRDIEQGILQRLREVIKVLVAGNLAIMFLQGCCVAIGFLIFGIEIPVLGGCLAALFSLIPAIGTSVVWIPAAIGLILKGHYLTALFVSIWCLFWYLFLENVAKPRFFGNRLNFHPLVFFFLLIGSIGAFSLPGIIVGPILLTLFFSLWEIYSILYIETPPTLNNCIPAKEKRPRYRKAY
ncbi:MAG TPA: AI-2E family transporter [Spirochaetota bacterium]